jgi:PKD repeat protein
MPDTPPSVDGLTREQPAAPKQDFSQISPEEMKVVKRWEGVILAIVLAFYALYILWGLALVAILPSSNPALSFMVPIGVGSAVLASLFLLGMGFITFMHIGQSKTPVSTRERSLIKLAATVVPGLLISGGIVLMITRQPSLGIDIVKPTNPQDFVAPLTMTFDLQNTVKLLALRGFHPLQYKWDINGDHKVDQTTVQPTLTATYDKEGVYTVSVSMVGSDGTVQSAARRFIISSSVFTITPAQPIVQKPVVFSVANLVSDPATITQVQWDFNGDGKVDSTTTTPQATNTFYTTGDFKVTATVDLTNKTEVSYSRTITVTEPPALPFPVDMTTIPSHLIGSAPFACLFSVSTKTPVSQVQWNFGDGQTGEGMQAAHTYTSNGNYNVEVQVRSQSGVTATIDTVVQVVNPLSLPDLSFTGTPDVQGSKITGEVPLTLNLTPHTNTPFVTFSWEAPDADEVGSTDTSLQAIYRHTGTYTVTLVGQDLNNHVLRMPITVTVAPASALVTFGMNPESGVAPLSVNFDASATSIPGDDISGFVWDFGDGTQPITGGASMSHQYTQSKTYSIGLTVQTVSGKTYNASRTLVVRAQALQACFTRSRANVKTGEAVQFFSDCSTGSAQTYLWDFGDGSQTDTASPVHTFTSAGTFNVKLTITDASGNSNDFSSAVTVQ